METMTAYQAAKVLAEIAKLLETGAADQAGCAPYVAKASEILSEIASRESFEWLMAR